MVESSYGASRLVEKVRGEAPILRLNLLHDGLSLV